MCECDAACGPMARISEGAWPILTHQPAGHDPYPCEGTYYPYNVRADVPLGADGLVQEAHNTQALTWGDGTNEMGTIPGIGGCEQGPPCDCDCDSVFNQCVLLARTDTRPRKLLTSLPAPHA